MPLQQQPDGVDCISIPASSDKSTLIGANGDDLPETGVDYMLEYLHDVAEQADWAVSGAFADITFAFLDRDRNTGSPR